MMLIAHNRGFLLGRGGGYRERGVLMRNRHFLLKNKNRIEMASYSKRC